MIKKSTDPKTQEFIDNIEILDQTQFQILNKLRGIVFDHFPQVKERIMYGGIIFSYDEDFGGVFVYKSHVSFEFSFGYKFNDPENLLEGGGKFRRHLKFRSLDDVEAKKADFFIKQAKEMES
ncbi:DUF1801 domain-containing protein [Fulvivirgaceae bacterium BMA10]|uniref:DUF1801 domain-containing protein n=1 Tax=Splendidivirga corallicola TaxID=3051826 RepID=A0ABT8KPY4_9BACT|nr:DUF1801 domain-containing protein [Fulvivirgaceae bacterium BMA10]